MAEERPPPTAAQAPRDELHETVRADAFPLKLPDATLNQLELSFQSAQRLLHIGAATRAFGELVRVSRNFPMSRRLAAYLVRMALVAKTLPAATALLRAGADDGEGSERFAVRRQLARLHRRSGQLELAREALVTILAEDPADRRARRVLNLLLEREERWEELDASLEKQAHEAQRRGRRDRAARAFADRARLSARLGHWGQAALRYGQAAHLLEQARRHPEAFALRLTWLSALVSSGAGQPALVEAIQICRVEAERTDQVNRFRQALRELDLLEDGTFAHQDQTPTPTSPGEAAREPVPDTPRLSAGELRRQEALFVASGRWPELAAFYRGQIARASEGSAKLELLSRLAEVLEDELHEQRAAAQAYGEMVALGGELAALKEQLRLLRELGDPQALEEALDRAVELARTPDQRADVHAERGELALAASDFARARTEFLFALRAQPRHLLAKVGLAEAAAASGELRPLRALLEPQPAISRKHPGRAELFRRLARLADRRDPKLARIAWAEVHRDLPEDDEANRRLVVLVRQAGDDVALEPLLRAQLRREPRGPDARKARMELWTVLERLDRAADAMTEVRAAVRFEPGHKEAWLALADRCERLGQAGEAAWALEQAATATDDALERALTWERLARFCRDVIRDPAKAALYTQRAQNARGMVGPASPALQTELAVTIPAPARVSLGEESSSTDPLSNATQASPEIEPTLARPTPEVAQVSARPRPAAAPPEAPEVTPVNGRPPAAVEPAEAPGPTPLGARPPAAVEPAEALEPTPLSARPRPAAAPPEAPEVTPVNGRPPAAVEPAEAPVPTPLSARPPPAAAPPEMPEVTPVNGRPPAAVEPAEAPEPTPLSARPAPEVEPAEAPEPTPLGARPAPGTEPPGAPEPTPIGAPLIPVGRTQAPTLLEQPAVHPEDLSEGADPTPIAVRPAPSDDHRPDPPKAGPKPPPTPRRNTPARTELEVPAVAAADPGDEAAPTQEIPAVAPPRKRASRAKAPRASATPRGRPRTRKAAPAPEAPLDQARFAHLLTDLPRQPKVPPAEILEWEAPPAQLALRRKTEELLVVPEAFEPNPDVSGFVPVAGSGKLEERDRLAKQVLARPLEVQGYRALSELFTRFNDAPRSRLMREIADALEGRPHGPLAEARPLNPIERAGLRHPTLRNEVGELLNLTGLPLCRAAGPRTVGALVRDEFRLDSGAGSRAVAEALLTSVRALAIRAPDLFLSEENGPPVSAALYGGTPRLLIGRLAVRRELPEGELRFHAARALFTLHPEVMALLTLSTDGLARAISLIGSALKANQPVAGPARAIREALGAKSLVRVRALYRALDSAFDVEGLVQGAADSANRAGLVVAGGVGPALTALRSLGASQREVVELIRFASSERYLGIRENQPPRVTSTGAR